MLESGERCPRASVSTSSSVGLSTNRFVHGFFLPVFSEFVFELKKKNRGEKGEKKGKFRKID